MSKEKYEWFAPLIVFSTELCLAEIIEFEGLFHSDIEVGWKSCVWGISRPLPIKIAALFEPRNVLTRLVLLRSG